MFNLQVERIRFNSNFDSFNIALACAIEAYEHGCNAIIIFELTGEILVSLEPNKPNGIYISQDIRVVY